MKPIKLIEHEASIVLVGKFNPAIFQPEWLFNRELITETDHAGAKVEIIHPNITIIKLAWAHIEVRLDKFIARTKDPAYHGALRDLVLSIFILLEHTPITAVGFNSLLYYEAINTETWHHIGHTLVPKKLWHEYLPEHIGMHNVTVLSQRNDGLEGRITVAVAPVLDTLNRILIDINSHIEINKDMKLFQVFSEHWENSQKDALKISTGILTKAANYDIDSNSTC
jgi:hypothetical protein